MRHSEPPAPGTAAAVATMVFTCAILVVAGVAVLRGLYAVCTWLLGA